MGHPRQGTGGPGIRASGNETAPGGRWIFSILGASETSVSAASGVGVGAAIVQKASVAPLTSQRIIDGGLGTIVSATGFLGCALEHKAKPPFVVAHDQLVVHGPGFRDRYAQPTERIDLLVFRAAPYRGSFCGLDTVESIHSRKPNRQSMRYSGPVAGCM